MYTAFNGLFRSMYRYITPPGTGFLPRETAIHHQQTIVALVKEALDEAKLVPNDIDAIAFTKVRFNAVHGQPGGPCFSCCV